MKCIAEQRYLTFDQNRRAAEALKADAVAEAGGCARLLSEDLSNRVSYLGIEVENPFHTLS